MEEEYIISPGMKVFYGLLAAGILVFGLVLMSQFDSATRVALVIFPFGLMVGSALIFINLVKKKVIISEHSIRCISLFSTKELDFIVYPGD